MILLQSNNCFFNIENLETLLFFNIINKSFKCSLYRIHFFRLTVKKHKVTLNSYSSVNRSFDRYFNVHI